MDWTFHATRLPIADSTVATIKLLVNISYWIALGMAIWRIVTLVQKRQFRVLAPLVFFVYNAVSYLPFSGQLKYRWPLQFVLILYAAALPYLFKKTVAHPFHDVDT